MKGWQYAALGVVACAAPRPESGPAARPVLETQPSGTPALLQAVSAPTARVVWVSGHAAAVLRSTDGGMSWERLTVPGAAEDSLQFRDVQAFDAKTAYVLSIGPGEASRIFKTVDGGGTWRRAVRLGAHRAEDPDVERVHAASIDGNSTMKIIISPGVSANTLRKS